MPATSLFHRRRYLDRRLLSFLLIPMLASCSPPEPENTTARVSESVREVDVEPIGPSLRPSRGCTASGTTHAYVYHPGVTAPAPYYSGTTASMLPAYAEVGPRPADRVERIEGLLADIARQEVAMAVLDAYRDSHPVDVEIDFGGHAAPRGGSGPTKAPRKLIALTIRHKDMGGKRAELTPEAVEAIANLPWLERLYVPLSDLDDEDCKRLTRIDTLKRLAIWKTDVTDRGVRELASLERLEVIDLHDTSVTWDGLDPLLRIPSLKEIQLHYFNRSEPVRGDALRAIAARPDLFGVTERVAISDLELTLGQATYLTDLDQVSALTLQHIAAANGSFRYVSAMPSLRRLELFCVRLEPTEFAYLSGETPNRLGTLARIESLTLQSTAVNEQVVAHIARMPRLRRLDLTGSHVEVDGMDLMADSSVEEIVNCPVAAIPRLAGSKSIWRLKLCILPAQGHELKPSDLASLRDLPNLEVLDLTLLALGLRHPVYGTRPVDKDVSNEIIRHVAKCKRLRALDVDCLSVDDVLLALIAKRLPRLEYLDLCDSQDQLTAEGLQALTKLPLKDLILPPRRFDIRALELLQEDMPDCRISGVGGNGPRRLQDVIDEIRGEKGCAFPPESELPPLPLVGE